MFAVCRTNVHNLTSYMIKNIDNRNMVEITKPIVILYYTCRPNMSMFTLETDIFKLNKYFMYRAKYST